MSIIFDALRRAEAQRQKGQAPSLARALNVSKARSNVRIWALVSLFVVLGLSAWWFVGSPNEPAKVTTTAVRSDTMPAAVAAPLAQVSLGQSPMPADLSLTESSAPVRAAVVATDVRGTEAGTTTATRLSVPNLDSPLTGAAQFDKRRDQVVVAAPIPALPIPSSPAKPVESASVTPVLAEVKPAQAPAAMAAPTAMAASTAMPAMQTGAPPVLAAEIAKPPEPALPSIFELEYQIRHDLPKMVVSMYVYNAQQQFRFVIIGGKRYAEGEQIESKVTVTKIRADGIECEFQGIRFFYPRQSL